MRFDIDSSQRLVSVLERSGQDERQRALSALLQRPMMGPDDPAFPLVRRHADTLRTWCAEEAGWSLVVEADFARLMKRSPDRTDGSRQARFGDQRTAFGGRRYVLFCLALAALERGGIQTTLGALGDAVLDYADDHALREQGFHFGLERREQRRDIVVIVRALLALRVLQRVAGEEEAYLSGTGDALYDIHRHILSTLLSCRRGPSTLAFGTSPEPPDLGGKLAAIDAQLPGSGDEARLNRLRRGLTARLLDDPVVYYADLPDDERDYLTRQRLPLTQRITDATGLVPELRVEGVAMIDPGNELSDLNLPEEGTEGHATLLYAEHMAGCLRTDPDYSETRSQLLDRLQDWSERYRSYWRKQTREPGGLELLADTLIGRLQGLRLLRVRDDVLHPLPAIARYALGEAHVAGRGRKPDGA